MADLVEFLQARLDEDERAARRPGGYGRSQWVYERETFRVLAPGCTDGGEAVAARRGRGEESGPLLDVDGEHIARHDPARVLAEVAAKRAIIAQCVQVTEYVSTCGMGAEMSDIRERDVLEDVLRYWAGIYADHADFRPEWRPEGAVPASGS